MRVSYEWLKDYVQLAGIPAQELARKITNAGIEVEAIEDWRRGMEKVVVGKVIKVEKHPNADKLSLCRVNIGNGETVQIVCGAPNVKAGQKVPVALPGAVLPGDFRIRESRIRGEVSRGMICSLSELGVEKKLVPPEIANGIYVFSEDAVVGTDALSALFGEGKVLELGVTPNRSDALSMIGVAYEVAALYDQVVRLPASAVAETEESAFDSISVHAENSDDVPYYGVRFIYNVQIGPAPQWMQNRLIQAGIRPINNVVDITNYVLLEYGQPLHAFDYDRIGSQKIVVRRAHPGEKIVTLDHVQRTLEDEQLVITNGKEPIGLAGIMGGATSEVTEKTTNVLLEAAYFDPARIRKGATALGLRTEASNRFEKGVDPNAVEAACNRAAALMAEYACGKVAKGIVSVGPNTYPPSRIQINKEKINRVLGTTLSKEEIDDIFRRLGFGTIEDDGLFTVTVPTRRRDLAIEEDLIEEVGRVYGYDRLPTTLPVGSARPGLLNEKQKTRRRIRRFLEGAGLREAITYSLTTEDKTKQFSKGTDTYVPISLAMPMSEERRVLRTNLVGGLLEVARYNVNRQVRNLALYEMGRTFLSQQKKLSHLPHEKERLAAVFYGLFRDGGWKNEPLAADFFVAKGVIEALFKQLGLALRLSFVPGEREGLHPGRTAEIYFDGEEIGFVGQLHPKTARAFDLPETYVFEVDLEAVFAAEIPPLTVQKLPRFPSVTRDMAVVVDKEVPADVLAKTIVSAGGELLKDVTLFDVYEGEHLEEGKKSLAYSLKFYDPERTLTDEEVTEVYERIIRRLREMHRAVLRT